LRGLTWARATNDAQSIVLWVSSDREHRVVRYVDAHPYDEYRTDFDIGAAGRFGKRALRGAELHFQ
jgi:hypothetical protein